VGKIAQKADKKRTPSDCVFGNFAHWVVTCSLFKNAKDIIDGFTAYKQTSCLALYVRLGGLIVFHLRCCFIHNIHLLFINNCYPWF